jgi:hypothetical protein
VSVDDCEEGFFFYSGIQMDEQVEHSDRVTFSLTPRSVAVSSERIDPETVSTVFLPARITSAHLMASRRSKNRQRETVETVYGFRDVAFTATGRGVNERATCSFN